MAPLLYPNSPPSPELSANIHLFKFDAIGLPTLAIVMVKCLYYFSIGFLCACNAGDYYQQVAQERAATMNEQDSLRRDSDSGGKAKKTSWSVWGQYELSDTFRYPSVGDKYPAHILNTSTYHSDEVDSSILTRDWYGMFKGTAGYYLMQTDIKGKRVEDLVLDEKGQKTAWEITILIMDTNVLLLRGLKGIQEGPVEAIPLSRRQLMPGESITFTFQGDHYKLYTTGIASNLNGEVIIKNYHLFLQGKARGKMINQLLVSHPTLEEAMVQLVFAGDINRDGLPDLLLDTAWHYNASTPTLYLSIRSDRSYLVEVVALHMSVGC